MIGIATIHQTGWLFPVLGVLLVGSCSKSSQTGVQGRVLSCGLYKATTQEERLETQETPSGVTRFPLGVTLIGTSTDQIPAKLGTVFGFVYQLSHVPLPDGPIEVTKVVTHPEITKPDGSTSTEYKYIEMQQVVDGEVVAWTGYGLDHDYELALGEWEFKLQFRGETVCRQRFKVLIRQ